MIQTVCMYVASNQFQVLLMLSLVLALAGVRCLFCAGDEKDALVQRIAPFDHLNEDLQKAQDETYAAVRKYTARGCFAFFLAGVVALVAFAA